MPLREPSADVYQAIADPSRRRMLQLLQDAGELPLKEVTPHFDMTRAAVSKHLRILADAGLVHERRTGRETRYRMDADPLRELKRWLAYFDRYWENKLQALRLHVEGPEPAEAGGPAEDQPAGEGGGS
ncbi:ArsR/SmtB family transcription factor [Paenibacillus pasadenensis]|uniref:Transcriptional regulator, ArsR family n=1 Tax=Paenibacillus pasadenensis TaxID=217090 RepID=A0A2N5N219_9BACL|nr:MULTISPECIES: metalloregulator ArsR/SmtB family transcription factor [Paenibacillus]PLT44387.1 Transcriptional regulator, ArsR family [Paenibacillus pasadenensis]QGG54877.1 metalloregulator ArsR/SmtB family transcription factor [Paenibacillus sp. B01]